MSFTFVAENEDAEKLLNYLLTYRKSATRPEISTHEEKVSNDNISIGMIPTPNETVPQIETPKSKNSGKY
jgi:hypothetical protein